MREVRRRLQQQRGLADARLAAEQHQRPGNDAAAEHAIELADAGRQPHRVGRFDFCVQLRRIRTAPNCAYRLLAPSAGGDFGAAAPRQASSRRRIRRSAPSTSATARRTPGRRRRLWVVSFTPTGHEGTDTRSIKPYLPPWLRVSVVRTCVLTLDPRCRAGRRSPTGSCRSPPPFRARRSAATISSPCRPMMTTSSPGETSSSPVTSTVIMSIDTAPTIGTRRPRIKHVAAAARRAGRGRRRSRRERRRWSRRVCLESPAVADAFARSQPFHRDDAAGQRHDRRERDRRRERRRHDAVEQQARANHVVPDARVAQQRRAVGRVA